MASVRRRIIEYLDRRRGWCQHCKREYDEPRRPPPKPVPKHSNSNVFIQWLLDQSGLLRMYEKLIK